jgi:outer membrane protein assembly factor BamB
MQIVGSLLAWLTCGGLAAAADSQPAAEKAVGWRGDGSGCYPAASPLAKWSAKDNVLWKTEVGPGSSSPVVAGSRVLVTAEPDLLVCLDAASGKELWRQAHRLADLPDKPDPNGPSRSSQYGDATPTPVSDSKWVWAFFNTGIVACHDLEGGKTRWVTWQGLRRTTQYGRTASPVLVGQRLLVHFGPLACLDAATGKLLWTCDAAKAGYGTPAPARIGDLDVVVTPKGHVVRLSDGAVLAGDLGNCGYTSPVVDGRVVYFIDTSMTAVRLPDQAADQIKCKELWNEDLTGDFYASPIVHAGRIYTVDRSANYYVIDAATGKTILKKTLKLPPAGEKEGPSVYPSPCLAGKCLYIANDAGEMVLLAPDDQGTQVASNALPAGAGGTPTFSGKRMFVRGGKMLYCIGEP